ncbi:hypothetical protein [Salinisphaera sp. LB1]|uniref:hypothetical protein n=1 Tax=Salinisphaera sp. LB1 TaxID=2183911 RepID=UPI000D707AA3|nr:hypothetical protein [Salinisphaera sp. LB1]AWN15550.1 hypothetical protein SALB1_1347 [Salinisphaera sp. LB1]
MPTVSRGRDCECSCIACGQPVIAQKSDVYQWYFHHAVETNGADESILHRVGKRSLIAAAGADAPFAAPVSSSSHSNIDSIGAPHEQAWHVPAIGSPVANAQIEAALSSALRANAVIELTEDHGLIAVEIHVDACQRRNRPR